MFLLDMVKPQTFPNRRVTYLSVLLGNKSSTAEKAAQTWTPRFLAPTSVSFCNALGFSQAAIGLDLAHLSRIGYRNIESGASIPRAETLEAIAIALGVTVKDLFVPRSELRHVRFRAEKRLTTRDDLIADVARWLGDFNRLEALVGESGDSLVPKAREAIRSAHAAEDPVRAAGVARLAFGLDPQESVRDVCGFLEERVGVKVYTPQVASDGFFGLSVSEADGGPVIVVNTRTESRWSAGSLLPSTSLVTCCCTWTRTPWRRAKKLRARRARPTTSRRTS